MKIVTEIGPFKIFRSDDCFVVQNVQMPKFAHSHIKNFRSARWVCEMSMKKQVPYDMPVYLLQSLLRINDDETYCQKVTAVLEKRQRQKDWYFNSQKGIRRR